MILTRLIARFGNIVKTFSMDGGLWFYGLGSRGSPDVAVITTTKPSAMFLKNATVVDYTKEDIEGEHGPVIKAYMDLLVMKDGTSITVNVDTLIAALEGMSGETVHLALNPVARKLVNPLDKDGTRLKNVTHSYSALVLQDTKSVEALAILGTVSAYRSPSFMKDDTDLFKGMVTFVDDVHNPKQRRTVPYGTAPVFDEEELLLDEDVDKEDLLEEEELLGNDDEEDDLSLS